jgi:hypothetical protein
LILLAAIIDRGFISESSLFYRETFTVAPMTMAEEERRDVGLKVIHAGFFRTATKSMAEAYRILGYKTHHGLDDMRGNPWAGLEQAAEATWPTARGARPRAPFEREDWDALWGAWDISTDLASPFAAQLIEAYLEAKVVVVQRDFETWWPSFKSELVDPLFPHMGWALFFLARNLLGYRAADAMHKTLFGMFNATTKQEIEDHARETYDEYYRRVRILVPAERRLEYKMGSGWEPLCAFLGKEVPDVPFPRVNDRQSHKADMKVSREKGIQNIMKVVLWCGSGIGVSVALWRFFR